jgi:hypothetical protein
MNNKKRDIVLGIHDFIPPEGRITVEVRDELTGKLSQRVRADNDVMDWYTQCIQESLQNPTTTYGIHYMGNEANVTDPIDTATSRLTLASTGVKNIYGYLDHLKVCSQLFLSDNTSAIATTSSYIPGTIIGAAETRSSTTYNNTKIGQVDYTGCTVDWGSHTWRYSFIPSRGNGTFQTVGYGVLVADARSSSNSNQIYPYFTPFYSPVINYSTPFLTEAGNYWAAGNIPFIAIRSSVDVSRSDQFYIKYSATGSLYVLTAGYPPSSTALYTVTNTNLGSPNSTWQSIVHQNDKLWVISGTNAWRYYTAPLASSTPTVVASGTFSGFTDTGVIDSASDGTNIYILGQTKVWVFDPGTQTITSSWTHSIDMSSVSASGEATISWNSELSCLMICIQNGSTMSPRSTDPASYNQGAMSVTKFFTNSGSSLNITIGTDSSEYTGSGGLGWITDGGLIQGVLPNGLFFVQRQYSNSSADSGWYLAGPNMRSAAVLASPVTKLASQTMTIDYEIAFS